VPAARLVLNLLYRAGEVEIDHVVAVLVQDPRGPRHRVRLAPHHLSGDGVVLVVDVDALLQPLAAREQDHVQ
jgi:hypothetical protein